MKSPNPAFAHVDVPLASTFVLSSKEGKESHVQPIIDGDTYRFIVKVGKSPEKEKRGTAAGKQKGFRCLMSDAPVDYEYIRNEASAGRMGQRLMAIVAEGTRGRIYISPTVGSEGATAQSKPVWKPDVEFFKLALGFRIGNYGMSKWSDLFTTRQLVALTTFTDLIQPICERVYHDALIAGLCDDQRALTADGTGATAYSDAITTYIALSFSKVADYNCSLVPWYTKEDRPGHLFSQQVVPMVWDYAELNPLTDIGGALAASIKIVGDALEGCPASGPTAQVGQFDAISPRVTPKTTAFFAPEAVKWEAAFWTSQIGPHHVFRVTLPAAVQLLNCGFDGVVVLGSVDQKEDSPNEVRCVTAT